MINMTLACSMCGKEEDHLLEPTEYSHATTLADVVRRAKWIGQQNGEHFDTYCSKKCAE